MRVLILGGTGFVGSAVAASYEKDGHVVHTLGRGQHGKATRNTTKELIHFDDVVNYDLIIDCASTVNDYNLLAGDPTDINTNVKGTFSLLEACRKWNPWARIVYVSTFFVVGDPPSLPVNEETVCRPKGAYGATKLCAEHLCRSYANVFGMDVVIARGTNIYGPGQRVASQKTAAFNWMCKTASEGGTIPLYDNGKVKRDYLYIDDAMRAIKTIAEKGKQGELYFFGSGKPHTFLEMVNIMLNGLNEWNILPVPSPYFHKRVGIGDFWVDNSKLKSLGWVPFIDIEEGIYNTVRWYKDGC